MNTRVLKELKEKYLSGQISFNVVTLSLINEGLNHEEIIRLMEYWNQLEGAERIPAQEALDNAGMTLMECVIDSIVPACCSNGCMVEPDGTCEHGHESVLLAMALI